MTPERQPRQEHRGTNAGQQVREAQSAGNQVVAALQQAAPASGNAASGTQTKTMIPRHTPKLGQST